eukprot:7664693-Alexandrium_andersonii.AAC.1
MGKDEFELPLDIIANPTNIHGTDFPPRIPKAPIAEIINTGALADEHTAALETQLARAEAEVAASPPRAGIVEAIRVDEPVAAGGDLPRAEAVPCDDPMQVEPVSGAPPRAEEPPAAPAEIIIPFSKLPGLVDVTNPVMQACHAAWIELLRSLGPEFIKSVIGDEADRITASPAIIPEGTWVKAPAKGRRMEDVVHTFRNMDPTKGEQCYGYEALKRIARVLHTCPKCEQAYVVGANVCPSCGLSTEIQSVILRRLWGNPAVKELTRATDSGVRLVRKEPTLRQQYTRSGAVAG